MIEVSRHAIERMVERLGINSDNQALDLANKAMKNGIEYPAKYPQRGQRDFKYNGFIYVFGEQPTKTVLVTVRPCRREELGNANRPKKKRRR